MIRSADIWRRVAFAMAALAMLAGCTSDGSSAAERLAPALEGLIFGEEDPPEPPVLSRAELAQIPFATLAISVPDGPRSYVAAVANNGGFIVYQDQARRSVVLEGGLLVGTRGLGYNLSAIKHQANDPISNQTPLDAWPASVVRNYQFSLKVAPDYQITVRCGFQVIARERIEIVELFFDVARVEETCTNGKRTFSNTYWVAPETGFIWKSIQWAGPRQPDPFVLEIIRPFG